MHKTFPVILFHRFAAAAFFKKPLSTGVFSMKYPYPRVDMTTRISADLLKLIKEAALSMNCTIQDLTTYCILTFCDPGESCPDWEKLSITLKK